MKETKKIIIFDLDGTLYDLNDVLLQNYDMQVRFLSEKMNIPGKEAESFLAEHHIYPVMKEDSLSATELFLQMGYDKSEWSMYRESGFDLYKIKKEKAIEEITLRHFSKFGTLVLLSSNAYCIVEKILSHLEISPDVFDDIICSDRFPYDVPFKKRLAMEFISEKYRMDYKNMYSIGDRYSTDIKPILELGGKGILVYNPLAIKELYNNIANGNLSSGINYRYFDISIKKNELS